jgi:hypothetical protein
MILVMNNETGVLTPKQILAGPNTSRQYYVNSSNGGWTFAAIPTVNPGDCSTGPDVPGCMQYYWDQTAPPTGNGGYQYLSDFYTQMNDNDTKIGFGELLKGFDWSNASWGSPAKVIAQQCGQILAYAANITNSYWSQGKQLTYLQTPTWNDYEEGTELETGVDSCWRVQNASYNSTNDTLSWQLNPVAGESEFASLSTVYDYNVWYVPPFPTTPPVLQLLKTLPKTATSLSGVSTLIGGPFVSLYVEMVGMPLIQNEMSNAANSN